MKINKREDYRESNHQRDKNEDGDNEDDCSNKSFWISSLLSPCTEHVGRTGINQYDNK